MYAAKKCGKYVVEFLRRLEFWLSLIIFFSRHKEISWPPDTSTVDCVHPSFSDPIWLQATKAKESNGMPVIKIEKILSKAPPILNLLITTQENKDAISQIIQQKKIYLLLWKTHTN